MFWSKLCKSSWNCAWNLAFPVFISPIVWNMCENRPYESVYFKELHNEQECYWPTIYRAGAAVVSTITSFIIRSSLFSPCDWSICGPLLAIYGPKFQRKCSFRSSKSLYFGKKGLNKVKRHLSTLVDYLDVEFVLQHFKLCLFVNKGDGETNW